MEQSKIDKSNQIDETALIGDNVELGKFNKIGKNVVIGSFNGQAGRIKLGDCNIINDNTRILAGDEGIMIGDWNVFHNSMLVMGESLMTIGHNCWFGQNTILDSSGGLKIGNGVRVGMYSQIWTHVASGELIEGCNLFSKRETIIKDNVWLVGSCIVSSGIVLEELGVFLIGSNITKSTSPKSVYAGNPAKLKEGLNFYDEITIDKKFEMMGNWAKEFVLKFPIYQFELNNNIIRLFGKDENNEQIIIIKDENSNSIPYDGSTVFNLTNKLYTKNLTEIERTFYKFIYNNKARFIPINK